MKNISLVHKTSKWSLHPK